MWLCLKVCTSDQIIWNNSRRLMALLLSGGCPAASIHFSLLGYRKEMLFKLQNAPNFSLHTSAHDTVHQLDDFNHNSQIKSETNKSLGKLD